MSGAAAPGHVAVVGASAAGLAVVEGLRRFGYGGRLTLVGAEPHLPYDRPPLSKQLLAGAWERDRLTLRDREVLAGLEVELRLGVPAAGLEGAAGDRTVVLADGERVASDAVVVTTGAHARRLPGTDGVAGVHVLRTVEDALALREALRGKARLAIVGGGFVGAEAAAVARSAGCEVVLVTDTAVPMQDVLGPEVGAMLARVHAERGVRIEAGVLAERVLVDGARAAGVRLADGREVAADAVLVGIGARPCTEWLAGSGVPVGNGVECDATLRAAEGVWAAGDVASWTDPDTGERLRVEHRTNAGEQGLAVARNILAGPGGARPFRTVPFVWSDQYELKVQIHGLPRGTDEVRVVDGSLAERRFTALYGRAGRVTAAVGVNMVRPLRALRPLVAGHAPWSDAPETAAAPA